MSDSKRTIWERELRDRERLLVRILRRNGKRVLRVIRLTTEDFDTGSSPSVDSKSSQR